MVFLGDTYSRHILARIQPLGWGRMFASPRLPRPLPGERWGLDNGAFIGWRQGKPFDERWFLRRLDHAVDTLHPPRLAVVPDLVAEGERSLEFSLDWLERLPAHYPWYLAVQDGMTEVQVEAVIDRFAGLFLGGTDSFKATAPAWAQLARRHRKQFHYARAGTMAKLRHAMDVRADSLDSCFPLWERERLERFIGYWEDGFPQPRLPMENEFDLSGE